MSRVEAEFGTEKDPCYYRLVNPLLLELVPATARRILDVGCGAGSLGRAIKDQAPGVEVWGIEREASVLHEARQVLDRVIAIDLNRDELRWDEDAHPFDCIICGDVLEHLVDPWGVLNHLVGRLVGGGVVVASLPNVRYHKVVKGLVLRGRFAYRMDGVLDATHLRFFTRREMEKLFTRVGLVVERILPRIPRHGGKILRILDAVTLGSLKEFRANQFLVVARKPDA